MLKKWVNENRLFAIEILRVYLGIGLFIKGCYFFLHMYYLREVLNITSLPPFVSMILAHFIIFAHVIGGLCFAAGFLTRLFALLNVPIIIGAVFFVHLKEGLFTVGQSLEFTLLILAVLIMYVFYGSGKFSADYYIRKKL